MARTWCGWRAGRPVLVALVSCCLWFGLVAAPSVGRAENKPELKGSAARPIEVTAQRISSFGRGSSTTRFGRLEFRGGLVLRSASPHFGGLSGIILDGEGRRMAAVSDAGAWLSGEIVYEGDSPAGLKSVRLAPLLATNGQPLKRGKDRDPESIALVEGSLDRGTVLVGFERNHRIGRFPIVKGDLGAPTGYLTLPAEAKKMKFNSGFEAMTVIRGGPHKGAVIAFAERLVLDGKNHTGWLMGAGPAQRLALTDGGYDITDVASLADGRLLVLERRFRWTEGVSMRLREIKPAEVRAGAVMHGEVLLEADMTYEIDNMEGLAVHKGAKGETVLTLVSDDNFNSFLQRTLLLQFVLHEGSATAGR